MTTAALMRTKLFGQGSATAGLATSSAGPHTTEALRQATDRLLKEQASAELSVGLYRQKLVEAQAAVKRLEEAYVVQHQTNAKLQGEMLWGPPGRCEQPWQNVQRPDRDAGQQI